MDTNEWILNKKICMCKGITRKTIVDAIVQLVPRLRPRNASDEALPRVREAEPQAGIPSMDAGNEC